MEVEILGNRYKLCLLLGHSDLRMVYEARDLRTQQQVAIKFERTPLAPGQPNEHGNYRQLKKLDGIPIVHETEVGRNGMRILVLELLGPSLADLISFVSRGAGAPRLRLKTVFILADQIFRRLRAIHRKKIVHRDIKPGNIAIGVGRAQNKFHLLDFGAAVPLNDRRNRRGGGPSPANLTTWKYASVRTHEGFGDSRYDDLESLLYLLISLAKGLPWERVEDKDTIYHLKKNMPTDELCEDLPMIFSSYHAIIRARNHDIRQLYTKLMNLFQTYFKKRKFRWDYMFDWIREGHNQHAEAEQERRVRRRTTRGA